MSSESFTEEEIAIIRCSEERSEGKVLLHNFPNGLEVTVRLPLINEK